MLGLERSLGREAPVAFSPVAMGGKFGTAGLGIDRSRVRFPPPPLPFHNNLHGYSSSSPSLTSSLVVEPSTPLRNQIPEPKPLADHGISNQSHLIQGSELSEILTASELLDVSVQVLLTHLVVRADIAAL